MLSTRTSLATQQKITWQRYLDAIWPINLALKLIFVLLLAGFLVYGDLKEWPMAQSLRFKLMDNSIHVWDVPHSMNLWIQEKNQALFNYLFVHSENQKLRNELEHLMQWRTLAIQLETENTHLKKLLNVAPNMGQNLISARVLTFPHTPYSHTIMINAGLDQDIESDQCVVVPEGVVGRIVEVGKKSARVLLTTDPRSHIPVKGETSNAHAILSGDHSYSLKVAHYQNEQRFNANERILTSGDGGIFPEGLVVGTVQQDDHKTIWPVIQAKHLAYVQVLNRLPINDF